MFKAQKINNFIFNSKRLVNISFTISWVLSLWELHSNNFSPQSYGRSEIFINAKKKEERKAEEMLQNSVTTKAEALNLPLHVKTPGDGNSVWEYPYFLVFPGFFVDDNVVE